MCLRKCRKFAIEVKITAYSCDNILTIICDETQQLMMHCLQTKFILLARLLLCILALALRNIVNAKS
jgi:hypothetical protein